MYTECEVMTVKHSAFEQFSEMDLDISQIVCIRQNWTVTHNSWSYLDSPRPNDGIIYIDAGTAVYTLPDGQEILVRPGDILYLPQDSRYFVKFVPDSSSFLLNFRLFCERAEICVSDRPFVACRDINNLFREDFRTLCKLYSATTDRLLIKAKAFELVSRMTDRPDPSKNDSVIAYINSHLNTSLSVADIAKSCAMSESSFRRMMIRETGLSPIRYILNQKIMKAKQLLTVGELSVEDIAASLGFYDSAHFIKIFKKETGFTPTKYRITNK